MTLKETIRNYALQNAIKFEGKVNVGAVIGKLLGENPGLKSKAKTLGKDVQAVLKDISSLSVEKMQKELEENAPELLFEKKEEKVRELPHLKNAKQCKVIMRFEPSPSGPLHIGHSYVLGLHSLYTEKYNGKLILRIADTNPENIYPPAYKQIPEDVAWMNGGKVAEYIVQSDRLEIYYGYMERFIGLGKAYLCNCDVEEFRAKINKMEACPCRGKSKEENFKRWKKMFKGYKQGDAVARMKTDIKDKNPAMRDFPVFRICEAEHPRQGKKYRVWPLMNMAVLCDDIDSGVTHIIRAKDHTDNAKRQEIMFKYLGKEAPEALFVGRINFKGIPVSCSKTRKAIEEGKYTGWEDIRIPFLLPLRKRGYVRGAFLRYAEEVGMSLTDKTVTMEDYFKALNAYNKELIDEQSYRYFFVWDPVKITIKGAPKQNINLDLYPGKKEKGREFETKEEFFISQDDFEALKEDEVYRLMDCLNFVKKGKSFEFHSKDYKVFKESGKKIIHWIPSDASVKVEVLMADNTVKSGVGELHLKSVKVGQTVQLERFGFCRLEMKEKDSFLFWFGHK